MNQSINTTLSARELKELIEASVEVSVMRVLLIQPTIQKGDDTLLNTKEAAQLIKYKESSIYGLVKRKKIPFHKVEGKLLFSKAALIEWINNKKR